MSIITTQNSATQNSTTQDNTTQNNATQTPNAPSKAASRTHHDHHHDHHHRHHHHHHRHHHHHHHHHGDTDSKEIRATCLLVSEAVNAANTSSDQADTAITLADRVFAKLRLAQDMADTFKNCCSDIKDPEIKHVLAELEAKVRYNTALYEVAAASKRKAIHEANTASTNAKDALAKARNAFAHAGVATNESSTFALGDDQNTPGKRKGSFAPVSSKRVKSKE
jgi:hypothetical protein